MILNHVRVFRQKDLSHFDTPLRMSMIRILIRNISIIKHNMPVMRGCLCDFCCCSTLKTVVCSFRQKKERQHFKVVAALVAGQPTKTDSGLSLSCTCLETQQKHFFLFLCTEHRVRMHTRSHSRQH